MNVYDFDGTILDGDSEVYFFTYVVNNKLIPLFNRKTIKFAWFLERKHIIKYTKTRPIMYKALRPISDNINNILKVFWDIHIKYIKDYYYTNHKDDDVIISATPSFILEDIAKRLHVKYLIGTSMDERFNLTSKWCIREEKVNRFKEKFDIKDIEEFYSDSNSDIYLARLSKKPYKVIKDKIEKWDID